MYDFVYNKAILTNKILNQYNILKHFDSSKQLLIHRYEDAARETGDGLIDLNQKAVCKLEAKNYFAVWIKTNLPADEREATILEELIHIEQSYKEFERITSNTLSSLNSVIWDLYAHDKIERIGCFEEIQRSNFEGLKTAIETHMSTGDHKNICLDSNMILWWYDLTILDPEKFGEETNNYLDYIISHFKYKEHENIWNKIKEIIHENEFCLLSTLATNTLKQIHLTLSNNEPILDMIELNTLDLNLA